MTISTTQNIRMAITQVGAHRFRSLLTVLGIVIGITTVVTVASLLTGLREGVVTFFQELGPDNIFLFKTSGNPDFEPPKERKRRALQPEYAETIRRWCGSVQDVGVQIYLPATVDGRPLTARVPGFETENVNITGQSVNMADISPRDIAMGRYFTS
jgi:putative ABC transport system permease protein